MLPKRPTSEGSTHIAIESISPLTYLPDFSMRTTLLQYHYHLLSLKEIDGVRVHVVVSGGSVFCVLVVVVVVVVVVRNSLDVA